MRRLHIGFHLTDHIFQRTGHELSKNFPVTIRQRLAGDFLAEPGRQSIVIIETSVVVAHRCKVNKPVKRLWKL